MPKRLFFGILRLEYFKGHLFIVLMATSYGTLNKCNYILTEK